MPEKPEILSPRGIKRADTAKMGNSKNPDQLKQEINLSAKREIKKTEMKAKGTVKSPNKSSEKVNFAWSDVHSSDEEDQNQPSSQAPTLWSSLRNKKKSPLSA